MIREYPSIAHMIQQAYQEHWALGQFNLSNLETLQAIARAANEAQSPVIVGVSMGSIRHVGLNYLRGFVQAARAEAQVPLYFHLDHGPDLATIESVIAIGFDSVMIDTSRYALEDNIQIVREVVRYAHSRGVCVEAQIGETWDEETGEQIETRTNPAEVEPFVRMTGIDYLAVSFGNTPGKLEGQAEGIDVALLREIARLSPVPLVLHGGTSIPDHLMREAVAAGAAKVNIDTAIRKAVTRALTAQYCTSAPPADPRIAFKEARQAAAAVIVEKMRLFGSFGRWSQLC